MELVGHWIHSSVIQKLKFVLIFCSFFFNKEGVCWFVLLQNRFCCNLYLCSSNFSCFLSSFLSSFIFGLVMFCAVKLRSWKLCVGATQESTLRIQHYPHSVGNSVANMVNPKRLIPGHIKKRCKLAFKNAKWPQIGSWIWRFFFICKYKYIPIHDLRWGMVANMVPAGCVPCG